MFIALKKIKQLLDKKSQMQFGFLFVLLLIKSFLDDLCKSLSNEKIISDRENQLNTFKLKIKRILGRSIIDENLDNVIKLKNEDFQNLIKKKFNNFRNKRADLLTKEASLELEKRIFLQTIDFLWRSHLQYLEHLRQVVGLRGYAQKDPLEEFKREAFNLFEGLLNKIKVDFITFLNNLEVVADEDSSDKEKKFKDEAKIPERKMGRNEPCFCGSGKKYKHCCGAL